MENPGALGRNANGVVQEFKMSQDHLFINVGYFITLHQVAILADICFVE